MKSTHWNIALALWFQAGVLVIYEFPNFLVSHSESRFLIYGYDNYQDFVKISLSLVSALLTVYAVRRLNGLTWRESLQFLGYKKPNLAQIFIGLASCLPLVLYLFYRVSCGMGSFEPGQFSWGQAAKFIFMAGFFEETFYRGFFFRMFRRNHSFISAAVLSGLFWSFVHLYGSVLDRSWNQQEIIVHLIEIFIYSIPAAWLFERGGNVIWGFMAAHVGWDLITSLFSFNAEYRDLDFFRTGQFYLYAEAISSGLVIWALSAWLLPRNKLRATKGYPPRLVSETGTELV